MQVAIVSDTHDNIWNLQKALSRIEIAEVLIHCGDLCSPFMIKHLAEGFPDRPIHIVWGNNDGDPRMICQVAEDYPHVFLWGQFTELELDGKRIAVNHYPEIALPLSLSGRYDLVCYGHDHQAHESRKGSCTLLNPGELLGMKGRPSFAWYDTVTDTVSFEKV